MDPISILATTAASQLFDYSAKFIETAVKLGKATNQIPSDVQEMEAAANDLVESLQRLEMHTEGTNNAYRAMCDAFRVVAEDLLKAVGGIKKDSSGSKWTIPPRAFRTLRNQKDIRVFEAKLERLRPQLTTHLMITSQNHHSLAQTKLESVARGILRIENKLDLLGSSGTEAPTEGSLVPSEQSAHQATRINENSTYQSVNIRSPARSRCRNADCVCSCHLNKYLRTPLLVKALLGALSFRGTCANHDSSLWELKYWVPEWMSNYNIYLLFERSACGSASLGLRFQRKVPWGIQDSIIRFSIKGNVRGIRSILDSKKGCLDDVDPIHGFTALHYAITAGEVDACKQLLLAGADRWIEDACNRSATQLAWERIFINEASSEMLDFFRVHFPEEDQDYRNFSPIHKAILGIEGFTLSQVLEHNTGITRIPINVMDSAGKTALHWAALRGDLSAVERLLDEGADVNAIDQHLRTPLSYAVDVPTSPRIVELLILSRADVTCPSDRGCTPLHYAARRKASFQAVKILIRAGAQIDVKNRLGNTAFVGAATHNNTDIGRILLEKGADRYNINHYGDTPLRESLHHNSHEFLSMLLKDGTRYNDINKHGASLLHAVALEGDFKTIEILKAAQLTGLDPQLLNSKGETAMDVCQMRDTTQEFKEAFSGFLSSLPSV